MFKKGFTLQEALITLAIVGIVAAITIPRLAKIAPDQNHAKYLKAYALLTDLTNEMLVDPALYFCYNPTDNGLNCTNMPREGSIPSELFNNLDFLAKDVDGNINSSLAKYFEIFAFKMHVQEKQVINNPPAGLTAFAFRAKDGIVWIFAHDGDNNHPINVDIDMDGISDNDEILDENSNNLPDRFAFNIDMDGSVRAADAMGEFYINNASDVNSKNSDKIRFAKDLEKDNKDRYRDALNVSQACNGGNKSGICQPL